ncbi:666_t:CDS:2, partial [Ambispora gerdemannii]
TVYRPSAGDSLQNYTKYNMAKKSSHQKGLGHFCFCMGLRFGSIFLTVFWLAGAILAMFILVKELPHQTSKGLTITFLSFSSITVIFAIYGLYALTIRNTNQSIRTYSKLAWILMVLIWSILDLAAVILSFLSYHTSLEDCQESDALCERQIKNDIIKSVAGNLAACSINTYFAIMLRAYLARREAKIRVKKSGRDSLTSISRSSHNVISLPPIVYNDPSNDDDSGNIKPMNVWETNFDAMLNTDDITDYGI